MNIPNVLGTAFFIEQFRWLFFNYVLESERILKKAGQLPQEPLPFLQNLLDFIITKYLKQEVDDDLSVCTDKRSPCGLSITGDIKIYQCHVIKR